MTGNSVPISEWYDERDDIRVASGSNYVSYSDSTNQSFNTLYDALRGELTDSDREYSDRFYAMFHWWSQKTSGQTPLPTNLRTQVNDVEVDDDMGVLNGILSPESVKEAASYIERINFERIEELLDSLYEDPGEWQSSSGQRQATVESDLLVKNWKHQKELLEFDRYNRFFGSSAALDHAEAWKEPIQAAASANLGFLLTVSY